MSKFVIKRDGSKQEFDPNKIIQAINKAADSVEETIPIEWVLTFIETIDKDEILIEHIQDLVEEFLMSVSPKVAKSYILYRDKRSKTRDLNHNKNFYQSVLNLASGIEDEAGHENGNKDPQQFFVMRDLIAGETCRKLYRENIMSPHILEMHNKGLIHLHDTDFRLMKGITNCELINLYDILMNGTVINGKKIDSPTSLKTASTIVSQVMLQVANSTYGGMTISISHLSPFIQRSWDRFKRIDPTLTDKQINTQVEQEIVDSIQTLLYQLNSMTASSGQAPFCSISLYVNELPGYEKQTARLIEEVLKQRIEGMYSENGNNINPAFPKLLYILDENNINPDSEYYYLTKLAAECTCKRMVPDYISAKISRKYKEGRVIPCMGKCKL